MKVILIIFIVGIIIITGGAIYIAIETILMKKRTERLIQKLNEDAKRIMERKENKDNKKDS